MTSGSTLTFVKSDYSMENLEVASGGTLNSSGATITIDTGHVGSRMILWVDGGGRINATNSILQTDDVNLVPGSSGVLASDTMYSQMDISDKTSIVLTGNDFTHVSPIQAYGSPTGTVRLVGNYWGSSDPNSVIIDHSDDATRPTAIFNPVQSNISTPGVSTTIKEQAASLVYQSSSQTVSLTAQVNGPSVVNEGTVTFTVFSGSKIVGGSKTVNVVNGVATVAGYYIPGLLSGGSYGIRAIYSGTANFIGSIDESAKLTITGAPTSTVASAGLFSVAAGQSVPLSAVVTSPNAIVNQGIVTFTLMDGSTVIGQAMKGTVVNGIASVSYPVPAGTTPKAYQVNAVYSATPSFLTSNDASNLPSVTVSQSVAAAAVVPPSGSITFSETSSQTVSLAANVTSAAGIVNEGVVTFTILVGNQVVGQAVPANVANGQATATYTIPAGTPASSYIVQAVYGGTANFSGSTDATQHFTINAASTTSAAVSTTGGIGQSVTISAAVTSPAGVVNEGTEAFTILNGATVVGTFTAKVVNGTASGSFAIPSSLAAGSYTIQAVFNPTNNFNTSSDSTQTLTAVKGSATTNTVGGVSTVFSEAAQTITISTMVSSLGGAVNGGTVTFTVMNGTTVIGSS